MCALFIILPSIYYVDHFRSPYGIAAIYVVAIVVLVIAQFFVLKRALKAKISELLPSRQLAAVTAGSIIASYSAKLLARIIDGRSIVLYLAISFLIFLGIYLLLMRISKVDYKFITSMFSKES